MVRRRCRRWHEPPAGPTGGNADCSRLRRGRCDGFLSRFLPAVFARRFVAPAGNNLCGEYRIAVVGLLVSGSGARWRRLYRTAYLQRERRKERSAGRALVQRPALRFASVALVPTPPPARISLS